MASDHKFMEYFYRIFLLNISQNVSFKKILKVVDILHLLLPNEDLFEFFLNCQQDKDGISTNYIFPFISCLKFIIVLLNLLINYYVLKERICQDKYNWNTKMSDLPTLSTFYRKARLGGSVTDSGRLKFFNGKLG